MIKSLTQVLLLYWRERVFRVLCIAFCIAFSIKPFTVFQEMLVRMPQKFSMTGMLLWLCGVCLTFLIGLMIKRQFVDFRAHLLPHYRRQHILGAGIVYGLLGVVGVFWILKASFFYNVSAMAVFNVIVSGAIFSLMNIILGYLSIGLLIFIWYAVWIVSFTDLYLWFEGYWGLATTNMVMLSVFIAGLMFISVRLWVLKEESFEHSFLFWWSKKGRSAKLSGNAQIYYQWLDYAQKVLGIKISLTMQKYIALKSMGQKIWFWHMHQFQLYRILFIITGLIMPVYCWYIHTHPDNFMFIIDSLRKYFFLIVYPCIFAAAAQQRNESVWGYDLLKPISRHEYFLVRVCGLIVETALLWFWIFVCLIGTPLLVLNKAGIFTPLFGMHMVLTLLMSVGLALIIAYLRNTSAWYGVGMLILTTILATACLLLIPSMTIIEVCLWVLMWACLAGFIFISAVKKWQKADY